MKIENIEKEDKKYYDELLYIQTYYYKILNNKNTKITRMTRSFYKYFVIALFFSIITLISYLVDGKDNFYLIVLIIYPLILLMSLFLIIMSNKRIKELMKKFEKSTININQNYIEYKSISSVYKNKWEDIDSILINKYSICFMPKMHKNSMISISIKYKDELIKTLIKYNKENLIYEK